MFDKHKVTNLYSMFVNLYENSETLYNELMENDNKQFPLVETKLSELFSIRQSLEVYLQLNEDCAHYEFTSLLSFFDEMYIQMKYVVQDNDQNTSWLHGSFSEVEKQYKIVSEMFKQHQ